MIMEDFAQYPEALGLKEIGYDEPCFAYYKDGRITGVNKWDREEWGFHVITNKDITSITSEIAIAPTYSQAFRWFRKNHGYHFQPFVDDNQTFGYLITYFTNEGRIDKPIKRGFKTPEEAEIEGLKKLIEIVKNEKQI